MSCHCDLLPHNQLLRLILPFLLLALAPHALAQPAANNFPPLPVLLQYQASKSKQGPRWAPFRKYAMRRMRLPETVAASDRLASDDRVYDLQGRRMDVRHLPKGIYIQHGKKFVVK